MAQASGVINEALKTPEFRTVYANFAMEPMPGTPESFSALIKADLAAWGPIIKASGFTAED